MKIKKKEKFYYSTELWARILFNFAVAYRDSAVDRDLLIESMIPFYHSRVLSFYNKTVDANVKDAEEYLENINGVFESEKYYLREKWNQSRRELAAKLFT